MTEFDALSVIFFRRARGKYYFYLTRKGPNMPSFPSTWTPIASVILQEDRELYSRLQDKHGEMSPNMLKCLTALRVVFQRNLVKIADLVEQANYTDVYDLIGQIEPEILNVWLHSMIPSGYEKITTVEHTFHVYYMLFIPPAHPSLFRMKLKRFSDIYSTSEYVLEEKAKWIKPKKLIRNFNTLKHLYSPMMVSLVEKLRVEYKSLLDTAREKERLRDDTIIDSYRILPYVWRFSTPAPDPAPYNTTNIFVVGNEHKYIIDPGSTSSEALSDLRLFIERNIETIDGILLTNENPDHCNQALTLKDDYDLLLCTSAITAKHLKEEGFVFSSILKEGTKIALGSYEPLQIEKWHLETLELPGSSKGSLGFLDSRGVLFSGIALHKDLTTSTVKYPESCSELLDSINRIKKFPVKYILSAHGSIIVDRKKTISENLERMKLVEKFVIDKLKIGTTTSDELTDLFILEYTPKWKIYAKSLILSNLEKLSSEDRINKIGEDYIWKKERNILKRLF
ncbi:MAG: MBL fold metallo-hydrolase [Candidatus Heimdallarchaeota archaeon]|nr:MBL fold metallo-hydrolase [Candidatus Heimdallarchaeota archaeon]MCK4955935.1 MBL fold metallo-hydrolase [Candidatus Heimdallarchaeota archaeon]